MFLTNMTSFISIKMLCSILPFDLKTHDKKYFTIILKLIKMYLVIIT